MRLTTDTKKWRTKMEPVHIKTVLDKLMQKIVTRYYKQTFDYLDYLSVSGIEDEDTMEESLKEQFKINSEEARELVMLWKKENTGK